jgi:hypothetical protein
MAKNIRYLRDQLAGDDTRFLVATIVDAVLKAATDQDHRAAQAELYFVSR